METFDFIELFGISLMFGFGLSSISQVVGMGVHVLFLIIRRAGGLENDDD